MKANLQSLLANNNLLHRKQILFALAILAVMLFTLSAYQSAFAEEEPSIPGETEGQGTLFSITDSDYLNVSLQSTETISLTMSSYPTQIDMIIRPVGTAASTDLTISGMSPSTTYYMYKDDIPGATLITSDASGTVSFAHELDSEHLLRIQAEPSTMYLRDDPTGGDCAGGFGPIGVWDGATKTCTLNTDLSETVYVVADGITLDGAGHTITTNGVSVYSYNYDNTSIKNLNIQSADNCYSVCGTGIYLYAVNNAQINKVSISRKSTAVFSYGASNSVFSDLTLEEGAENCNYCGIGLYLYRMNNSQAINVTANGFGNGIYDLLGFNNTYSGNASTENFRGFLNNRGNGNTIHNNLFLNNYREGLYNYYARNTVIYNNDFIDNWTAAPHLINRQAYDPSHSSYNIVWNRPLPIGGNYYSHYDEPSEGCTDNDANGFCDAPWNLAPYNYQRDNYPHTSPVSGTTIGDPVDTTPPTVAATVVGTLGDNGWYTSAVTVSWAVSDDESAVTTSGCDAVTVNTDTAGTTFTCEATSQGGTTTDSVTIQRDATAPTASASALPAPNAAGWNNTDITVSFSGSDAMSGIASCSADSVLTAEGANQSASGVCTDNAGNSSDVATANGINIDKTAPTASASASPAPNAAGWNNTDVTVSFSGSDALSGIASCSADSVLTAEGTNQLASGVCVDKAGNTSPIATAGGINIDKTAPTAVHSGPFTIDEGSSVTLDGSGSTDNLSGVASTAWDNDNDGVYNDGDPATFAGIDNGTYSVALQVVDAAGNIQVASTSVAVNNVVPSVSAITAPVEPVAVNSPIDVSASFIDPGVLDTHLAQWDWGNGISSAGVVTEADGDGSVAGSYAYSEPGVYTVMLTVTDKDSGSATVMYQYVVVYDPNGGFVTGGGWIMSPAGAYVADPSASGKANFGFVSKYKRGANVPTGQTEFQFKAGDLNFHSSSYEWLVIAGQDKAKYKGVGTINGEGNYGFMLTAVDNGRDGDTFRIKIWDKDNGDAVVYDNQLGSSDDAYDGTVIGGGNIKVHTK